MIIVQVHVHVKAKSVDDFKAATIENASKSVNELGIARFDVIQQNEDPTRFILIEAYRSTEATTAHKETAHYKKWRDEVADMMAEPRTSLKYTNVYPGEDGW